MPLNRFYIFFYQELVLLGLFLPKKDTNFQTFLTQVLKESAAINLRFSHRKLESDMREDSCSLFGKYYMFYVIICVVYYSCK